MSSQEFEILNKRANLLKSQVLVEGTTVTNNGALVLAAASTMGVSRLYMMGYSFSAVSATAGVNRISALIPAGSNPYIGYVSLNQNESQTRWFSSPGLSIDGGILVIVTGSANLTFFYRTETDG